MKWKPLSEELRGWILASAAVVAAIAAWPVASRVEEILGPGRSATELAREEAEAAAAQLFGPRPQCDVIEVQQGDARRTFGEPGDGASYEIRGDRMIVHVGGSRSFYTIELSGITEVDCRRK